MWAPGVRIVSAEVNATGQRSGTSQAAPFVTGAVALYLEKHPVCYAYPAFEWYDPLASSHLLTELCCRVLAWQKSQIR